MGRETAGLGHGGQPIAQVTQGDTGKTGSCCGRMAKLGAFKYPLITAAVLAVIAGGIAAAYFAKAPGIHSFIHHNTIAVAAGGGAAALTALVASSVLGYKCAHKKPHYEPIK